MTRKTFERILRKFESLPFHHIDTSVILEPYYTEDGRYCRRYLNLVGNKYRAVVSFPVMSEVLLAVCELKNGKDRYDMLDVFTDLVDAKKIIFYAPKDIAKVLTKIKEVDKRIEPADMEIVACGIENGCNAIITLDKNLIRNEKLKNEFGIKIIHPKDLV